MILILGFTVQNDTIVFGLEPFHCVFLGKAMTESNMSGLTTSMNDIETCLKEDIKFRINKRWNMNRANNGVDVEQLAVIRPP